MHNGAKYTAEALPKVIEGLKEKGYEIVPVSELIYKEDYHLDVTGRQIQNGDTIKFNLARSKILVYYALNLFISMQLKYFEYYQFQIV